MEDIVNKAFNILTGSIVILGGYVWRKINQEIDYMRNSLSELQKQVTINKFDSIENFATKKEMEKTQIDLHVRLDRQESKLDRMDSKLDGIAEKLAYKQDRQ